MGLFVVIQLHVVEFPAAWLHAQVPKKSSKVLLWSMLSNVVFAYYELKYNFLYTPLCSLTNLSLSDLDTELKKFTNLQMKNFCLTNLPVNNISSVLEKPSLHVKNLSAVL